MADTKTSIIISAEDKTAAAFASARNGLQGLEAAASRIPMIGASLAGMASVAGLAASIDDAVGSMGRLADMSKQTDASVEFLSSIKTTAKLAGTSLDDVAGSIQKLSVNLGNAKLKGEKSEVFKSLGIDPATTRDTGEALVTLAKRLDAMPDKMKAISIARDLLGKNASMPFIEELARQQEFVVKVTTAQAEQAKAYEDNLVRLKAGANQLGIAVANSMLPAMNEVLRYSLEVKKEWGMVAGIIVGLGGGSLLKLAGVELDPLKRAAKETTESLNALIEAKRRLREEESTRATVSDDLGPLGRWFRDRKVDSASTDAQSARQRFRASLAKQAALEKDKTEADYQEYMRGKRARDLADGALGTSKEDKYTPLMRSVNERITMLSADSASTDKLTESQRFLIKTVSDLDGGYTKLTDRQKTALGARLEELVVVDEQNKATEARRLAIDSERKATEEWFKEEERVQALIVDFNRGGRVTEERLRQQADMIGMSERQKQIIEAARKVEDDATEARRRAWADIKDPRLYQEAIDGINASLEVQKKRIEDATGSVYDYSTSWESGAKSALASYLDSATDMARQTENLFSDLFGGMEDGLVNFVKTGKFDFKSLSDSIISDLIRIQARQAIAGATGGSNGWLANLFGGGVSSSGSYAANDVLASANGNVFSSSGLAAYSSSIVSSPTFFKFANGASIGLMGEAGPEAIMPLKRGADGKLGVAGSGGGVVINVIEDSSRGGERQARQGNNGESIIDIFVAQVKGSIAKDVSTGQGLASVMERTYGLSRSAGAAG